MSRTFAAFRGEAILQAHAAVDAQEASSARTVATTHRCAAARERVVREGRDAAAEGMRGKSAGIEGEEEAGETVRVQRGRYRAADDAKIYAPNTLIHDISVAIFFLAENVMLRQRRPRGMYAYLLS